MQKAKTEDCLNPLLSPHTLQNENSYYSERFIRVLTDDFPQLEYRSRRGENKTAIHFGQRGLLISEVEFLTISLESLFEKQRQLKSTQVNAADLSDEFNKLNLEEEDNSRNNESQKSSITAEADFNHQRSKILVIYVGAAVGTHLRLLIDMFPYLTFLFIDPIRLKDNFTSCPNVIVDSSLMTDEKAKQIKAKYQDWTIYYISDIRDLSYKKSKRDFKTNENNNELVIDDMAKQMSWYRILCPEKSYLKFRLPYPDAHSNTKFEYLDGDIYFLPWATNTSTETRLLVDKNAKLKTYDIVKYERQLFRFNLIERVLCYKHNILFQGFDHCYDCNAEINILNNYLNFKRRYLNDDTQTITGLLSNISRYLQTPRERLVRIFFNRNEYDVFFNDMRYGLTQNQVFTPASRQLARRRGPEHLVDQYEYRH